MCRSPYVNISNNSSFSYLSSIGTTDYYISIVRIDQFNPLIQYRFLFNKQFDDGP
jgi:hypothetical protein